MDRKYFRKPSRELPMRAYADFKQATKRFLYLLRYIHINTEVLSHGRVLSLEGREMDFDLKQHLYNG